MSADISTVPTCSLRATHPELSAGEIAKIFEMTPRFSWTKGQGRKGFDGRSLLGTHKESYCAFPIQFEIGAEAEPQIRRLLTSLDDVRGASIREFVAHGGAVVLYMTLDRNGSTGLSLDAETTRLLGSLSVQLDIELA